MQYTARADVSRGDLDPSSFRVPGLISTLLRSLCPPVECLIEGHGEKVSCCMVSPQPRPPHRLLLTSNGRRNASGLGVTMPISAPLLPRFLLSRSR